MAITAKRVSERMRQHTSDGREAPGIGYAAYYVYDLPPRPGQTGWVGVVYATSARKAIAQWRKERQGKTD